MYTQAMLKPNLTTDMRFTLSIIFFFVLLQGVQAQTPLLTDEERQAMFGKWVFRNGIWQDQWTFYSEGWAKESNYPIPSRWVEFRDDNSGGGQGTTPAFQSYVSYVNSEVAAYNAQPSVPIDGGLSFLAAIGLGLGIYTSRKRK